MNPHWNDKLIDGRQLMLLLFLGRMFSMMIYSPGSQAISGDVTLAVQPAAMALELLLLIPALWVTQKYGRRDLLDCAYLKSRILGKLCAFLCLITCLLQTARTITVQTDFFTGTIYHLPSRTGLMVALWIGILYAAWLGLASFSRLSMGVLLFFALICAALVIQVFPRIDLLNLHNPLAQGFPGLAQGTAFVVNCCGELAAAVLLIPSAKNHPGRWSAWSCILWTIFTALIVFLTQTVLGSFAATRTYPVYTLALAGGEFSVFSRLDALLLVVWIFLALIRGAMYLWLAAKCLFLLTRKKPMFCILSSGIGSLLIAAFVPLYLQVFENQILWGSAMLTVTLAVPLLTALCPQKRGEQR